MTKGKFLALGMAAAVAFSSGSALASDDKNKVFKKCKSCHSTEKGKHKIGPSLAGIIGKKAGSSNFKKYKALKAADWTWDEDNLKVQGFNPNCFNGILNSSKTGETYYLVYDHAFRHGPSMGIKIIQYNGRIHKI